MHLQIKKEIKMERRKKRQSIYLTGGCCLDCTPIEIRGVLNTCAFAP